VDRSHQVWCFLHVLFWSSLSRYRCYFCVATRPLYMRAGALVWRNTGKDIHRRGNVVFEGYIGEFGITLSPEDLIWRGGNHSQLVAGCYTSHLLPAGSSISPQANCLKPKCKEGLIYCLNTLVFCRVVILDRASFQIVLTTLFKVAICL